MPRYGFAMKHKVMALKVRWIFNANIMVSLIKAIILTANLKCYFLISVVVFTKYVTD